ncbi:MAG: hypothetical protein ACYCSP_12155 [Acidobacteriaceae bacterium]
MKSSRENFMVSARHGEKNPLQLSCNNDDLASEGRAESASVLRHLPQDFASIVSGKTLAAQCEAIRWSATISPGYCTSLHTAKEN